MKNGSILALVVLIAVLASAAYLHSRVKQEIAALDCESERASEAKAQLGKLAAAEAAYFTEHHRYTSDLTQLEHDLDPSFVVVGFAGPPSSHVLPKIAVVTSADLPADAVATSGGFLAAAAGNFDDDPAVFLATVDQTLAVTVRTNDCRE